MVSCKVVPCLCLPPTWCCGSGARISKRPVLNLALLLMTVKLRLPIVLPSRRLSMLPGSSTRAKVLLPSAARNREHVPGPQPVLWGSEGLPVQAECATDMTTNAQQHSHKRASRLASMVQVLQRLCSLPAAIGKGVYGQEAQSLPLVKLKGLRCALLRVTWEGTETCCPEAVVAMCLRRRSLDPEMAIIYTSMCAIRRALQAPALLRAVAGFVALALRLSRLAQPGWQCLDGLSFHFDTVHGPVRLHALRTPAAEFQHHVRSSLRAMLLRRAARRRKDFVCVEDADLVLLRKSLQSLLSGSVVKSGVAYPVFVWQI